MFERFTQRARRVLVLAEEEARSLDHGFIAPEHVLLGLLDEGEGLAAEALRRLGVSLEPVRTQIAGALAKGTGADRSSKRPFSAPAKRGLELSLREALRLGHNYIGTEHLLLGLLRLSDGSEGVTRFLGVDPAKVRAQVMAVLAAPKGPDPSLSPGLADALGRARRLEGPGPTTTGQVLLAMLADVNSQARKVLELLGVDERAAEERLAEVPVEGTSDAPPHPRSVEIRLGESTTTIEDPELAEALAGLGPDELRAALAEVLDRRLEEPGRQGARHPAQAARRTRRKPPAAG